MEKKLIARLNEIGLEIGYPYEVLKNGQYRKANCADDKEDVALIVCNSIQPESLLSEMYPDNRDKKLVWSQLFPNRPSLKDAVLTQQELTQLIMFGHRATVLNYLGRKNVSERTARLLVARNDDELLYKIRALNYRFPPIIANASIIYMSDSRFTSFIAQAVKLGFYQFLASSEEVLIKQGSLAKFKAYIKYFKLRDSSEFVLIQNEKPSFLKAYVDAGYTLNKELEETLSYSTKYQKVYSTYLELRTPKEEKTNKQ